MTESERDRDAHGRARQTRPRDRLGRPLVEGPQALELLAACLAAGLPARTACSAVVQSFDGPVADDLGQVLSLMELGVADVDAWRVLDDHPQLGLAAADLARSVESGTSMVEGLQHHAAAWGQAAHPVAMGLYYLVR